MHFFCALSCSICNLSVSLLTACLLICVFCRLGVIEEEREEDERKLSVAIAAAERVNVLVSEMKKVHSQRTVLVNSSLQDPHFYSPEPHRAVCAGAPWWAIMVLQVTCLDLI